MSPTPVVSYSAFKGITIATVMCKFYSFKETQNSKCNVKVGYFVFKGPPTAVIMCKYLGAQSKGTFKGAQSN